MELKELENKIIDAIKNGKNVFIKNKCDKYFYTITYGEDCDDNFILCVSTRDGDEDLKIELDDEIYIMGTEEILKRS